MLTLDRTLDAEKKKQTRIVRSYSKNLVPDLPEKKEDLAKKKNILVPG
jgi:hypothetical protein